jgi:hypothetical protein
LRAFIPIATITAEGSGDTLTLHLELLRFKRMLEWIVSEIIASFHDDATPCAIRVPRTKLGTTVIPMNDLRHVVKYNQFGNY